MKCWKPIEPALDSNSKSNEKRRNKKNKTRSKVTTSLDIITVINGIVQVGGDVERQSRAIFNRNTAFLNLISKLKKN